MTKSGFQHLKDEVLHMLEAGLDPRFTYHSTDHTIDVMRQADRIAVAEKITDPKILLLIQIASLFHDTGFLFTYNGHEAKSCEILDEYIDISMFNLAEIGLIKAMIMATKIPQSPRTLPEKIICDADLDYLGREDFESISEHLRSELMAFKIIKNEEEWDFRQVDFIENHRYFTGTSQLTRQPAITKYLETFRKNV